MSKISELTDGGSLLPTDTLIAVRSGANVKVVNDTINVTTLNPDQINMGDNEQIRLGDSQDLLIYHDGTNSRINDNGTGNLLLQTGGVTKLEVTTTGIDVTGTVTADGLTVDGNNDIQINRDGVSSAKVFWNRGVTQDAAIELDASESLTISVDDAGLTGKSLVLKNNSKVGFALADGGDISFYEDTGTTAKLFWDASAERLDLSGSDYQFGITQGANQPWYLRGVSDGSFRIHLNATGDVLTIDSSGNVGIGTASPNNRIDVTEAQDTVANVLANGTYVAKFTGDTTYTTGASQGVLIGGVDGSLRGVALVAEAQSVLNDHNFIIAVSGASATPTERLRIDSSGNLLVGTTNTNPHASSTENGIALRASGYGSFSANGTASGFFNRRTSDGDIVDFRKDGTTVGSIGTSSSSLYIGKPSGSGLMFQQSNTIPVTGSSAADATYNLGAAGVRFKDLYLSGGVYVGGTVAANYLDDYEEGTWTPVIADAESGGNEATTTTAVGEYTKVGNIVTIVFEVINIDTTGLTSGNQVFVTGLPFIAANSSGNLNYTAIVQGGGTLTSATTVIASIQDNKQQLRLQNPEASGLSSWITVGEINSGTTDLRCSLTYRSA